MPALLGTQRSVLYDLDLITDSAFILRIVGHELFPTTDVFLQDGMLHERLDKNDNSLVILVTDDKPGH